MPTKPKTPRPKAAPVAREWLSPDDLVGYTGLGKRAILDALKDPVHPIPHVRLGHKTIRVLRADFDRWMLEHRSETERTVDEIVAAVLG